MYSLLSNFGDTEMLTVLYSNQTNLAIKGIIALEAMSKVAELTNHEDSVKKYTDIAHDYFDFWSIHGINHESKPPHSTLSYDNFDTYGMLCKPRKYIIIQPH